MEPAAVNTGLSHIRQWLAVAALACLITPAHASVEDQIKAAFLLNFAKFVEWPASQFASPDAPVQLCLQVPEEVAEVIENTLASKSVGRRPMQVQSRQESLSGCHLVYLRGDPDQVRRTLQKLPAPGLLSVYEHPVPQDEGVIRLFLENRKIRFSIDTDSAREQELTISAKLLSVAR
ncbi:MAG: YfiR family protein [Abyssibacter sp.]|uniref:YfiR family protein n=1 Tax=Abyssibacter sp. TaxID=2320200 RepID=UPI00321C370F